MNNLEYKEYWENIFKKFYKYINNQEPSELSDLTPSDCEILKEVSKSELLYQLKSLSYKLRKTQLALKEAWKDQEDFFKMQQYYKHCKYCGSLLIKDKSYCINCGASIQPYKRIWK